LKLVFTSLVFFSEPNQILFLKQKFIGELLDILCRNQSESEQGKVAAKIAGSILETFLHIVPSSKFFSMLVPMLSTFTGKCLTLCRRLWILT
jgi:hypothetical protein